MNDPDFERGDHLVAVHTNYERAARIFCQKTGMDADAVVHMPSKLKPRIAGVTPPMLRVERWRLVAEELYDLSLRLLALREAVQQQREAREGVPQ